MKERKNVMREINKTQRELWVDYVKVLACTLVVLGHFFQSLVAANILPANDLYQWFDKTIYYFHVPLFFICSGYLYQKLSHVYNFKSWKKNIIKKFILLGIPYFVFSSITWIMKVIFSGSVNSHVGGECFILCLPNQLACIGIYIVCFFAFLLRLL